MYIISHAALRSYSSSSKAVIHALVNITLLRLPPVLTPYPLPALLPCGLYPVMGCIDTTTLATFWPGWAGLAQGWARSQD